MPFLPGKEAEREGELSNIRERTEGRVSFLYSCSDYLTLLMHYMSISPGRIEFPGSQGPLDSLLYFNE